MSECRVTGLLRPAVGVLPVVSLLITRGTGTKRSGLLWWVQLLYHPKPE